MQQQNLKARHLKQSLTLQSSQSLGGGHPRLALKQGWHGNRGGRRSYGFGEMEWWRGEEESGNGRQGLVWRERGVMGFWVWVSESGGGGEEWRRGLSEE